MITTKEKERKALAKIKKIIDDLGENSYVGTAFDGVFDLAYQNIADDAAYCFTDQIKTLNSKIDKLNSELTSSYRKIDDLEESLNKSEDSLEHLKKCVFNAKELFLIRDLINFDIAEIHNNLESAIKDAINNGSIDNLKDAYERAINLKNLNEKIHKLIY